MLYVARPRAVPEYRRTKSRLVHIVGLGRLLQPPADDLRKFRVEPTGRPELEGRPQLGEVRGNRKDGSSLRQQVRLVRAAGRRPVAPVLPRGGGRGGRKRREPVRGMARRQHDHEEPPRNQHPQGPLRRGEGTAADCCRPSTTTASADTRPGNGNTTHKPKASCGSRMGRVRTPPRRRSVR